MDKQERNRKILAVMDIGVYTLQEVADVFGLSPMMVSHIYRTQRGIPYQQVRQAYRRSHPQTCSVDGCVKLVFTRELCNAHYTKMRYASDPVYNQNHKRYARAWQRAHPEEDKVIRRRSRKAYKERNPEKIREYHRRYRQTHREQVREWRRRYYQVRKVEMVARTRAWRQTHREQVREACRRYYQNHKAERKVYQREYYHRLKQQKLKPQDQD